MEYPYECAEQTLNRYYANALASKIANSSPRIKQIFENGKQKILLHCLQSSKKRGIKICFAGRNTMGIAGKNEEQQKKNIALLFDMVRMSSEMNSSL